MGHWALGIGHWEWLIPLPCLPCLPCLPTALCSLRSGAVRFLVILRKSYFILVNQSFILINQSLNSINEFILDTLVLSKHPLALANDAKQSLKS
jgi:hypothetical protein